MKITKLGHSCVLVQENDLRILIDPGTYTTAQNSLKNLDVILITQEHADHFDIESIRVILTNNPDAKIFTNRGVAKVLDEQNIKSELLEHGQQTSVKGVVIEGFGNEHAEIYKDLHRVQNTGYLVAQRFFHPGDALYKPSKPVEILALPVAGPWLKISEVIEYAKDVKPKVCFPIHDGMLKITGAFYKLPEEVLSALGIKFMVLKEGTEVEF